MHFITYLYIREWQAATHRRPLQDSESIRVCRAHSQKAWTSWKIASCPSGVTASALTLMAWLSLARQSRRSSFFFGTSSVMIASCSSPAPHAARAFKRPVHMLSQAPPPPPTRAHASARAAIRAQTSSHVMVLGNSMCPHARARTRTCMTPGGHARDPQGFSAGRWGQFAGTNLRALGGCLRAWQLRLRTSRSARRSWPQIPPARPPISARRPSDEDVPLRPTPPSRSQVRTQIL
jgi:hypothetical protein